MNPTALLGLLPLAGSLFGGLFGGKSPQEKVAGQVTGQIPNLLSTGQTATNQGLTGLGSAQRYYQTILGGDRTAISNALAPQTSTVLSQYDNAAKAVQQFAPRGGGTTSTFAQLPFQKATALGGAWQGALPGAATGAASTGSATAGIGSNLTGQATSSLGNLFNYQQLNAGQYGSLGSGIGQVLANLFKKGGGGGSSGGGSLSTNDSGDSI